MDVQGNPCNPQTIELFLADRLGDAERTAFEDHLEGCPACREGLDGLAAEGRWWEEARGYLTCPGPSGGEGLSGGDGSNSGNEPSDDALSACYGLRNYLTPTDDPRMLGRLGRYEVAG